MSCMVLSLSLTLEGEIVKGLESGQVYNMILTISREY